MKHSGFRIEIETDEKGYRVNRSKSYFSQYDKAILLNISDEIDLWLNKDKADISVIGTGTNAMYTTDSLFRILIDKRYGETSYSIVNWRNSKNGTGERVEYSNKKELKDGIRYELKKVAEIIFEEQEEKQQDETALLPSMLEQHTEESNNK